MSKDYWDGFGAGLMIILIGIVVVVNVINISLAFSEIGPESYKSLKEVVAERGVGNMPKEYAEALQDKKISRWEYDTIKGAIKTLDSEKELEKARNQLLEKEETK